LSKCTSGASKLVSWILHIWCTCTSVLLQFALTTYFSDWAIYLIVPLDSPRVWQVDIGCLLLLGIRFQP
jgi:hypothetical protein